MKKIIGNGTGLIDADKCTLACTDAGCSDKTKCTNVGYKWMYKITGSTGVFPIDAHKCTSAY